MRNPNITQALTVAQQVYHTTDDDGSKINLIADLLIGMYGLNTGSRELIYDAISGDVVPVRAVRAIKAIAAAYDTEA